MSEPDEPYFIAWAVIHDGKVTAHQEETGIGLIHDYPMSTLMACEKDLFKYMQEFELIIPEGAYSVEWRVTKLFHDPGQQTFPETGAWDFLPYWEMEIQVVGFQIQEPTPVFIAQPITATSGEDTQEF